MTELGWMLGGLRVTEPGWVLGGLWVTVPGRVLGGLWVTAPGQVLGGLWVTAPGWVFGVLWATAPGRASLPFGTLQLGVFSPSTRGSAAALLSDYELPLLPPMNRDKLIILTDMCEWRNCFQK